MFDVETELQLRRLERTQRADDRGDVLLRWGLILSNLTVLALLVAHLA